MMRVQLPTSFISETTNEVIREVAADAPTVLGIGLDTAIGIATGGGVVAAGFGAWKLLKVVFSKNRGEVQAAVKTTNANDPFPRRLDEARQHRELREYTERRVPEYDAAVGRIIADEIDMFKRLVPAAESQVVSDLWDRVRNRVDKLMPPSTREYRDLQ